MEILIIPISLFSIYLPIKLFNYFSVQHLFIYVNILQLKKREIILFTDFCSGETTSTVLISIVRFACITSENAVKLIIHFCSNQYSGLVFQWSLRHFFTLAIYKLVSFFLQTVFSDKNRL